MSVARYTDLRDHQKHDQPCEQHKPSDYPDSKIGKVAPMRMSAGRGTRATKVFTGCGFMAVRARIGPLYGDLLTPISKR
jgi:hypothetical protein